MPQEYLDYIERNQPLIEFLIKTGQCTGLSLPSLRTWIDNFPDDKGKYFAVRILKHFLFYSDSDVLRLLESGLEYSIKEKEARQKMLEARFTIMPSVLTPSIQKELDNTVFIPLLSDNKPTESGQEIIRLLSKKLHVKKSSCMFHWDLNNQIMGKKTRIVIVDDNIGSGDQLEGFWEHPSQLTYGSFEQMLEEFPVEVIYLTLVAVSETIRRLKSKFPKLVVIASEEVGERYRVFSDDSYFWRTPDERAEAKKYIEQLAIERGIGFLGHKSMDYALMIGKYIPDWTLPIFWQNATDWKPLI